LRVNEQFVGHRRAATGSVSRRTMIVSRRARVGPGAFAGGRRKKWRLNHSPLYLDFLEGKVDFSVFATVGSLRETIRAAVGS
jgi:hypothetical protein